MWKFIEKLRTLPEGKRKALALFSSTGITGVILLSWLVFPVPHFGVLSAAEKERKNAENLITPFSAIGGELRGAIDGVKNEWSSLGGTAGIVSALFTAKDNFAKENATSVPEVFPDGFPASSTDETITTLTAAHDRAATSTL